MNIKNLFYFFQMESIDLKTIIFPDTDHTVGNLLQDQALQYNSVLFCAYDVPHPLKKEMQFSILTDDSIDPNTVINKSVDTIITNFETFEKLFEKSIKKI